jgi:hypothetical protein
MVEKIADETRRRIIRQNFFLLKIALLGMPGIRETGLPDGIFSNQKSQLGPILEGLRLEIVGLFHGHFKYFTAIWYILWPFGTVVAIWNTFPHFGTLCRGKSGSPAGKARDMPKAGTSSSTWSERASFWCVLCIEI